jgi:PAS domain S-box-containing protein
MMLSWYVSNCFEAVLGATLVRRYAGGVMAFDSFRGTWRFLVGTGLCAPVASSFVDAGFVVLNGWGDAGFWTVWRTRVASNVLATMTIVPVMLTAAGWLADRHRTTRRDVALAVVGLAALGAVCWTVFVQSRPASGAPPALLYAPLPLLVGAAIRFGPLGASVSMLACALLAISGAVQGRGPFVSSAPLQNALSIQLFLIVAWVPVMALAAILRERARAEHQARCSEEQLALAIDAAQLGRWEWDIDAQHLTWSDGTRRIYEVPLDEPVTAQTFHRLVHPDDRHLLAAAIEGAAAGRDVDVEFRVRFPDGRVKWILSRGKTVFDGTGRAVRMIGIKADITARKVADLQREQQRTHLAQLSPVAAAGELSVALAHDMNQPLAAILTNAGTAQRYLRRDPPDLRGLAEILDAISHDNRRAASIVARYGALLSRRQARRIRVDPNDVVAAVADVVRTDLISRGVSLAVRQESGLPGVLADPLQLKQVLLNLVSNACEAMESCRPDRRTLTLGTDSRGGGVRLSVEDSGPGIPPDLIDSVFEPFVTSKPQRLGLGLAISRSIVDAHGGRLLAENQADGGACVRIDLPAIAKGVAAGPAAPAFEEPG